jgi:hypothetical protein
LNPVPAPSTPGALNGMERIESAPLLRNVKQLGTVR